MKNCITIFIAFVVLNLNSASASENCKDLNIKRSNFLHRDAKWINPNHFEERALSLDDTCAFLGEINNIYPSSLAGSTKIKFILNWDYARANATASYDIDTDEYTITFDGGLLNLPFFTKGALATVACHEVGHIIAGTPKTRKKLRFDFKDMNLSEGMSDYFATHKCLKKLYSRGILKRKTIASTSRIDNICSNAKDYFECITVLSASYDNFRSSNKDNEDLSKPSTAVATGNYLSGASMIGAYYPTQSCRFDIAISGYFCSRENRLPCGVDILGNLVDLSREYKSTPPKCFLKL